MKYICNPERTVEVLITLEPGPRHRQISRLIGNDVLIQNLGLEECQGR